MANEISPIGAALLSIHDLRIKLYADSADLATIMELRLNPWIQGFTTNSTLMRKAAVENYEIFARDLLDAVPDLPVSFGLFADDEKGMEAQARVITSWGSNVNVKVPVTDQSGNFMGPLIRRLSSSGIVVNVTAVFTLDQIKRVTETLNPTTPAIVSVFAGRIADTGVDPVPILKQARSLLQNRPHAELLWASPRELLNIFQADGAGCDIITIPPEILGKLRLVGKDLTDYSLETVHMFHHDARAAGYSIQTDVPV
jgi:transaldolase